LSLPRKWKPVIVTADVGLNRVAAIQGVCGFCNLNDVANSLQTSPDTRRATLAPAHQAR
jgi:uncharacterized protein YacL